MKGLIFTSFIDFAEQQLGPEFVDEMLDALPLSTGGAYTNVGTYPAGEILDMVNYILARHDIDGAALQQAFGKHTFGVLANRHGDLVAKYSDGLACIFNVDQVIHRSVRKLYPDAELPDMQAAYDEFGGLDMEYRSARPFMHLALGLIQGCLDHFGDDAEVEMTDLSGGAGTHARFRIRPRGAAGATSGVGPAHAQ